MTTPTNFQRVSFFNDLIGNAKGVASIDQIQKQYDLIMSEMVELGLAIEAYQFATDKYTLDKERIEIRDGIADVLVTTYGLAHRMGIDADADMVIVCDSNNSKFYKGTETNAGDMCLAMTRDLGIKIELRQRVKLATTDADGEPHCVWAFISADDSDPERPRGKLLKAPCYKPPVFS